MSSIMRRRGFESFQTSRIPELNTNAFNHSYKKSCGIPSFPIRNARSRAGTKYHVLHEVCGVTRRTGMSNVQQIESLNI